MSTVPVVPVAAPAAPAAPKSVIQITEEQIFVLGKQREQAIANVHAVEGALQGAQHLLVIYKNEVAKAEAFAKEELAKAQAEAKKLIGEAKTEAGKVESGLAVDLEAAKAAGIHVVDEVEAEAKKL